MHKVSITLIMMLVALALALCLISWTADGAEPVSAEWVARALQRCPVPMAERSGPRATARAAYLDAFAVEIARVAPTRERAAMLVAIGERESNWDSEVIAGRCKPWACDRGRARGAFQVHRMRLTADDWDAAPGNVVAQVRMADRLLALSHCPSVGAPAGTFRAYAGRMCGFPLRDEAARVAAYYRALRTR